VLLLLAPQTGRPFEASAFSSLLSLLHASSVFGRSSPAFTALLRQHAPASNPYLQELIQHLRLTALLNPAGNAVGERLTALLNPAGNAVGERLTALLNPAGNAVGENEVDGSGSMMGACGGMGQHECLLNMHSAGVA